MNVTITRVTVSAEITCEKCGETDWFDVDDGDVYFSESQMIDAVTERMDGWDTDEGICRECMAGDDE